MNNPDYDTRDREGDDDLAEDYPGQYIDGDDGQCHDCGGIGDVQLGDSDDPMPCTACNGTGRQPQ